MHCTQSQVADFDDSAARIQSHAQEDLVHQHVAKTSKHSLIEEYRLDRPPICGSDMVDEFRLFHGQDIGTQRAVGRITTEAHSAESTGIGHDQRPVIEGESESLPSLVIRGPVDQSIESSLPINDQATGHPEMKVDRVFTCGRLEFDGQDLAVAMHAAHRGSNEHPETPSRRHHDRIVVVDRDHLASDDVESGPSVHFDFQHLGHGLSMARGGDQTNGERSLRMRHWGMADALTTVVALAVFGGLVWLAYRIEPHWASRDGRRMIARVQPLGGRDEPDGRWREMRAAVDDATITMSTRGIGSAGLRGVYRVRGKSSQPPKRRAIYILEGERRILLRIPSNSRAIPVLDALIESTF